MKKLNKNQNNSTQPRRITGQGMTEYIIVVALIALAAVVVVGVFGDVVQKQFVAMGQELSGGDGGTIRTAAQTQADGAATANAGKVTTLGTYTD